MSRPLDTATTTWDWDGSQWVEREKTAEELAADDPPELVEVPRPEDTADGTWEPGVEIINGVPTRTWTQRPWTQAELDGRTRDSEREAARSAVRQIITDLQAEKARAQVVIDKQASTITGTDTKDLARAIKRLADAVIDLVRYVG